LIFDNHENPNGAGMKVYGNIFYQPAGDNWVGGNGAIGGWTGNGGEEFHNVEVYNNTFVNLRIAPLGSLSQVYSGNAAHDNLFYNCTAPSFSRVWSHDYNWFYNSGGTAGEDNGQAGSSNPFMNMAGLDFRLASHTSSGLSLNAPYNLDPNGVTRGSGGIWDRGAYQLAGNGPTPPTGLISTVR
jgi:hypothetical protein